MNEALAILDWYAAMGVDEALEEIPQNRLIPKPKPTVNLPSTAAAMPSSAGSSAAQPANAASAKPQLAPSVLIEEVKKLAAAANTLEELQETITQFKELSICKTATKTVFAEGVTDSDLMILGEAPGAEEDRQGVPFCGENGQLLDKMLAAIGYSRKENCYISNTLYWRPPGNRKPTEEELQICQPFVQKHIALLKPKVLFLTGGVAIRSLLQDERSIGRIRGQVYSYKNPLDNVETPVVVSYHPSYLLRTPTQKRLAWQDLLLLKAQL